MAYSDETKARMQELNERVRVARGELIALMRAQAPEPVEDFTLQGPDGDVPLSSLFGDKDELIVIHNMGSACPYCTLWADGFNGLQAHFENRAAFVVVSPDTPEQQKVFAEGRGWTMRMVSNGNSGFTAAMGFVHEDAGQSWNMPGYSTFRRDADGVITRAAYDVFGPGDAYNPVWHMFPLLPEGVNAWEPQFDYA